MATTERQLANEPTRDDNRGKSGTLWALTCLALSGLYIINPTAGVFELIPDNLPIIGNLDEAAAAALFLSALRYFGIDPLRMLERRKRVADDSRPRDDKQT